MILRNFIELDIHRNENDALMFLLSMFVNRCIEVIDVFNGFKIQNFSSIGFCKIDGYLNIIRKYYGYISWCVLRPEQTTFFCSNLRKIHLKFRKK